MVNFEIPRYQAKNLKQSFPKSEIDKGIKVNFYNINNILNENFPHGIDLLSIDVEGLDYDLLSTINFKKFSPKLIISEVNAEKAKIICEKYGYNLIYTNGVNSILIDNKLL